MIFSSILHTNFLILHLLCCEALTKLSNLSSIGKVDFGYTTFGNTALAVTSVGGKTRKEFRSGPLKVSRDMFIGSTSLLSCTVSVATTSAIKSYFIKECELDDPNFEVGGRDPGNKCENG